MTLEIVWWVAERVRERSKYSHYDGVWHLTAPSLPNIPDTCLYLGDWVCMKITDALMRNSGVRIFDTQIGRNNDFRVALTPFGPLLLHKEDALWEEIGLS